MEEQTAEALLAEASRCICEAHDLLQQTRLLCQEAMIQVPKGLEIATDYTRDQIAPPAWCVDLLGANADWVEMLDVTEALHRHLDLLGSPRDRPSAESAVVGSAAKEVDASILSDHHPEELGGEVSESNSNTSPLFVEADEIIAPESSRQPSSNSTLEYIRARLQRAPRGENSVKLRHASSGPNLPRLNLEGLGQCSWLSGGKTQGETYTTVS